MNVVDRDNLLVVFYHERTPRHASRRHKESEHELAQLIEVKSLGGTNFVRPDRVMVVQTSPTGNTLIVMEGGTIVNSSESTKEVAARLEAALLSD